MLFLDVLRKIMAQQFGNRKFVRRCFISKCLVKSGNTIPK